VNWKEWEDVYIAKTPEEKDALLKRLSVELERVDKQYEEEIRGLAV
jgi:hypothetical protein